MAKLDNRYSRDVQHRIAVLTASIDSGKHDKEGRICLQMARRALEKMIEDWNHGEFHDGPVAEDITA